MQNQNTEPGSASITRRAQIRRQDGPHKHPTASVLDSQSVKTAQRPGIRGYDAGKKVKGRKRHILVDTMDPLLAVLVTAASVSDPVGANRLFKHLPGACKKLRKIWIDGTYRGRLLEWVLLHCPFHLQPILRCEKGFAVLPRRWVVERTFSWIVRWRRLCRDHEGLPSNSEALIQIAMSARMLNALTPTYFSY